MKRRDRRKRSPQNSINRVKFANDFSLPFVECFSFNSTDFPCSPPKFRVTFSRVAALSVNYRHTVPALIEFPSGGGNLALTCRKFSHRDGRRNVLFERDKEREERKLSFPPPSEILQLSRNVTDSRLKSRSSIQRGRFERIDTFYERKEDFKGKKKLILKK